MLNLRKFRLWCWCVVTACIFFDFDWIFFRWRNLLYFFAGIIKTRFTLTSSCVVIIEVLNYVNGYLSRNLLVFFQTWFLRINTDFAALDALCLGLLTAIDNDFFKSFSEPGGMIWSYHFKLKLSTCFFQLSQNRPHVFASVKKKFSDSFTLSLSEHWKKKSQSS